MAILFIRNSQNALTQRNNLSLTLANDAALKKHFVGLVRSTNGYSVTLLRTISDILITKEGRFSRLFNFFFRSFLRISTNFYHIILKEFVLDYGRVSFLSCLQLKSVSVTSNKGSPSFLSYAILRASKSCFQTTRKILIFHRLMTKL